MAWTDSEKDQFYKRLAVLAETLGEPLSPVRLAGYCEALEDVPLAAMVIGLRAAARACRFFPKPVELRELALESPEWRRLREQASERALTPFRPPQISDAERRANIAKLKGAIKALRAPSGGAR